MKLYRVIRPMFDKYDKKEEIIPVGSIIEYESEKRAKEAVKNELVEEVKIIKLAEPVKKTVKKATKK